MSGYFLFVPIASWNSSPSITSTSSIHSISLSSSFSDPVVAEVICSSAAVGFAFDFDFFSLSYLSLLVLALDALL